MSRIYRSRSGGPSATWNRNIAARIRNQAQSAINAQQLRFRELQLGRELTAMQLQGARLRLYARSLEEVSGFTGTSGPPTTPAQAIGTAIDQLIATIDSMEDDEFADAVRRKAAVNQFFKVANALLPKACHALYGGIIPGRTPWYSVAVIGTDREAIARIARESRLLFRSLDEESRQFEEYRLLDEKFKPIQDRMQQELLKKFKQNQR